MGRAKPFWIANQNCLPDVLHRIAVFFAAAFFAAACTAAPPATVAPSGGASGAAVLVPVTAPPPTLRPTKTAAMQIAAIVTETAAAPPVCAPFPGYTEAQLLAAISNPFNPPPLGSDDPHQAIDLAVVQNDMALAGGPVQAVLAGRMAMVILNRFPYGNAVLIETRLADIPPGWLPDAVVATPAPTLPAHPVLSCPPVDPTAPASGERSFYLLYAHLEEAPLVQPGQNVACGALLGAVGQTGNALNPHLHLEARLGPSGWSFDSLAHYDSTASAAEMGAYCLWRVSNLFQLIDPRQLLTPLP